jgi:hypothetical protein
VRFSMIGSVDVTPAVGVAVNDEETRHGSVM